MVNVGFDLYQLSQADNDVDVARFSTQLAFDYASLVLGAAGMGAGLASAATAAAFLGGASVIVGGLAVGVAALAEGFAMVAERSKQVGVFFYELDQAYRGAAFSWDKKQKAWQAHPKLVIQSLNLRDGVVTYGSQRLFRCAIISAYRISMSITTVRSISAKALGCLARPGSARPPVR